jgi:hypothetical protein
LSSDKRSKGTVKELQKGNNEIILSGD